MNPVLLDTGVIVALLDRSERRHGECARTLDAIYAPLVTCEPVIAEACYLTRKLPGAPEAILQNVAAGTFQIPIQLSRCAAAIQRILRKYRDQQADLGRRLLDPLGLGAADRGDSDSGQRFRRVPVGFKSPVPSNASALVTRAADFTPSVTGLFRSMWNLCCQSGTGG